MWQEDTPDVTITNNNSNLFYVMWQDYTIPLKSRLPTANAIVIYVMWQDHTPEVMINVSVQAIVIYVMWQ